ncbi:MAG: hypothetical protein HYV32_04905 [Candidatus Kerfeldbacteria bacterium]|nr:hypothetical protein [Candidatus Kerfeldbacteria bacterium]
MNEPIIQQFEERIQKIEKRNKRVEADKAWETSWFRVFSICAITYVVAAFVMWIIGVQRVYLNALIPVVGYFLSTQSLPAIKKWWVRKYNI